jgi:hypothetical protein
LLSGAAFRSLVPTSIFNCSFDLNTCQGQGAVAEMDSGVSVAANCSFRNNSASYGPVALLLGGKGNISDCDFVGNIVNANLNVIPNAGAVSSVYATSIVRCRFEANVCYGCSGAALFLTQSDSVELRDW